MERRSHREIKREIRKRRREVERRIRGRRTREEDKERRLEVRTTSDLSGRPCWHPAAQVSAPGPRWPAHPPAGSPLPWQRPPPARRPAPAEVLLPSAGRRWRRLEERTRRERRGGDRGGEGGGCGILTVGLRVEGVVSLLDVLVELRLLLQRPVAPLLLVAPIGAALQRSQPLDDSLVVVAGRALVVGAARFPLEALTTEQQQKTRQTPPTCRLLPSPLPPTNGTCVFFWVRSCAATLAAIVDWWPSDWLASAAPLPCS